MFDADESIFLSDDGRNNFAVNVSARCSRRGLPPLPAANGGPSLARHSIYSGDADIMQSTAASCLGKLEEDRPDVFFHVYLFVA